MEKELSNKSKTDLTQSTFSTLVKVADNVGEKLGESLSEFIDKCFGVKR